VTFLPIAKADLIPLAQLDGAMAAVQAQILSRLHHSEVDRDFLASAVADLYASQAGAGGDWTWSNAPFGTDPGIGGLRVTIASGTNRTISFAKIDADGIVPSLSRLAQGATIVLTDDPDSPPTTAFRQYVVTANPVDHGSWVSMQAIRVATFGTQDTPPVGSRVRLLIR
jgi:hypothetical protein